MKKLLLIVAVLTLSVSVASADVLWDQYAPDPATGALNDFDGGGCGFSGFIGFSANDVNFPVDVVVQSITTVYDYYGDMGTDLLGVSTGFAYLMIVPKTGPLFSELPSTYPQVATTVALDGTGQYQELTASGLNLGLAAGDYWVTLTPIIQSATGLTNQHYIAASQIGDGLMYLSMCGFGSGSWLSAMDAFGIDLDTTLLIEGDLAVANESASFGSVKSLFR